MKEPLLSKGLAALALALGLSAPAAHAAEPHQTGDEGSPVGLMSRVEQHEKSSRFAEQFKRIDRNGDGELSFEELVAHRHFVRHFDAIDANQDDRVSATELQAFLEARREARLVARQREALRRPVAPVCP